MAGIAGVIAAASPPTLIARRPSFRRTLRENEGALPTEYLDLLEQKRKQLDESIHKYIAAKEREYKQYERDVKQQLRSSGQGSNGNGGNGRRSSAAAEEGKGAVDALMNAGQRRSVRDGGSAVEGVEVMDRPALAGLTDRRTSEERDKEFVGLFTPPFLPAIDGKEASPKERRGSAPPKVEAGNRSGTPERAAPILRSESDTAAHPRVKRPAHLQLAQRTSSSGSSADGKLTSAMKSPSHAQQRPKRKRVSLAVGDTIVAPSDNVPSALSISSTASHSRTRSPETEREPLPVLSAGPAVSQDFASSGAPPVTIISTVTKQGGSDASAAPAATPLPQPSRVPTLSASAASNNTVSNNATASSSSKVDPDGDLFDLEDDSDPPSSHQASSDEADPNLEETDDADDSESTITGRLGSVSVSYPTDPAGQPGEIDPDGQGPETLLYDPEGGLLPPPTSSTPTISRSVPTASALGASISSNPGFSPHSSRQPTSPGFRRPSVAADPIFSGEDGEYVEEEIKAATEEIYGSSFTRPGKGSFGTGSLGESYMMRFAERRHGDGDAAAGRERVGGVS